MPPDASKFQDEKLIINFMRFLYIELWRIKYYNKTHILTKHSIIGQSLSIPSSWILEYVKVRKQPKIS